MWHKVKQGLLVTVMLLGYFWAMITTAERASRTGSWVDGAFAMLVGTSLYWLPLTLGWAIKRFENYIREVSRRE
jgi:hypothetical protein